MAKTYSFDELIQLLRSHDKDATADLFKRYARRLIGLARTRLDERVRGKVDPEDVVQSVMRSFFNRVGKSDWTLESEDSLWALLVAMTVRKCGRKANFELRKKRGGGTTGVEIGRAGDSSATWEPADPEPSPDEAAALEETMERLASQLDDRERVVFEMSLQGYSVTEISDRINRTTRTVYRALDRIRELLEEMRKLDLGGD